MTKQIQLPYIFVIGNEKGGAGKTTCAMHLITGMMDRGLKVASIDTDSRQHSLTRYIQNRVLYNEKNPEYPVPQSMHFLSKDEDSDSFHRVLSEAKEYADVIVIDTPGSFSSLSCLAHSHADTVVTPINDSFVDLDVMAKVNPDDLEVIQPSIYSQMIWEQKMARAKRDGGSIDWVVMRNRLSSLDAMNKRAVLDVLNRLSDRIGFRMTPGFGERVIFRELFLQGLTLMDLMKTNYSKILNISHIAARQELRDFLKCLKVDEILEFKGGAI
jgi:chromosome partitioning protein